MPWAQIDSPVGVLLIVANDVAVTALSWGTERDVDSAVRSGTDPVDPVRHPVLAQAVLELDEYFSGNRRTFDVHVEVAGTEFQRHAWQVLRTIAYGDTISYAEQARRMGRPRAVRAVGGANGRNPVGIIVPCHRVIGADGSLTGFGGGLGVKQWLLEHERGVLEQPNR